MKYIILLRVYYMIMYWSANINISKVKGELIVKEVDYTSIRVDISKWKNDTDYFIWQPNTPQHYYPIGQYFTDIFRDPFEIKVPVVKGVDGVDISSPTNYLAITSVENCIFMRIKCASGFVSLSDICVKRGSRPKNYKCVRKEHTRRSFGKRQNLKNFPSKYDITVANSGFFYVYRVEQKAKKVRELKFKFTNLHYDVMPPDKPAMTTSMNNVKSTDSDMTIDHHNLPLTTTLLLAMAIGLVAALLVGLLTFMIIRTYIRNRLSGINGWIESRE